jgi:hypothetical protein
LPTVHNPWMRAERALSNLSSSAPAPSAELTFDALRLLLWLCSERAPAPRLISAGPQGSVLMRWDQDGSWFELEATTVGRAKWRAQVPGGDKLSGVLNRQAVELLRSIIPIL